MPRFLIKGAFYSEWSVVKSGKFEFEIEADDEECARENASEEYEKLYGEPSYDEGCYDELDFEGYHLSIGKKGITQLTDKPYRCEKTKDLFCSLENTGEK